MGEIIYPTMPENWCTSVYRLLTDTAQEHYEHHNMKDLHKCLTCEFTKKRLIEYHNRIQEMNPTINLDWF